MVWKSFSISGDPLASWSYKAPYTWHKNFFPTPVARLYQFTKWGNSLLCVCECVLDAGMRSKSLRPPLDQVLLGLPHPLRLPAGKKDPASWKAFPGKREAFVLICLKVRKLSLGRKKCCRNLARNQLFLFMWPDLCCRMSCNLVIKAHNVCYPKYLLQGCATRHYSLRVNIYICCRFAQDSHWCLMWSFLNKEVLFCWQKIVEHLPL